MRFNLNQLAVPLKIIQAIAQITHAVMDEKQYADKVFEAYFKNHRSLSSTDTGFIVHEVNHLIRNWRLLIEIQSKLKLGSANDIEALLNIAWIISKKPESDKRVVNQVQRNQVLEAYRGFADNRAVLHSFPNWIDNVGDNELTERWPVILNALKQEPRIVIRANTIKCAKDKLRKALQNQGVMTEAHSKAIDALIFISKLNVFKLPEFKQGFFEMQDISSQLVGHFANPQPGMRVIDGCAGNGGKTLHLASLMQNKGRIIALDLFPGKLDTLRCRASRAGISIIETRAIDTTKVIKRLHGTADLVLLDVPCSGLGVLKRNPEIKWRLQPNDLENLKKTQEEILHRYSLMVKPGGKLIYSTCSILSSENSQQIQKFLENHRDKFEFVEERFISPEEGFDGFYMASLKRRK